MRIKTNVKAYRAAAGLTQQQLAEKLEVLLEEELGIPTQRQTFERTLA